MQSDDPSSVPGSATGRENVRRPRGPRNVPHAPRSAPTGLLLQALPNISAERMQAFADMEPAEGHEVLNFLVEEYFETIFAIQESVERERQVIQDFSERERQALADLNQLGMSTRLLLQARAMLQEVMEQFLVANRIAFQEHVERERQAFQEISERGRQALAEHAEQTFQLAQGVLEMMNPTSTRNLEEDDEHGPADGSS